MELEGFGASLVGRPIYVYADKNAWIPFEFVSGVNYNARILVTKSESCVLPLEYKWDVILRPSQPKDWSVLATLLRGMGKTLLLVFDVGVHSPPDTFYQYLASLVAEGKILLTRLWIGTQTELPLVPDAVFFPPLYDQDNMQHALDLCQRLPERAGHSSCQVNHTFWHTCMKTLRDANLGVVVSDVGESSWTFFWHKIQDSHCEHSSAVIKRMLAHIRCASHILESYSNDAVQES